VTRFAVCANLTRRNPKKNRVVLLKALKSSSDSLLCPVKLLLVLALRLGNVVETTIEGLIQHTAGQDSRIVVWTFPDRPVLCAFSSSGATIMPDRPAGTHQLSQIMAQAALAAGFTEQLCPHDLRRGAARDTAHTYGRAEEMASSAATTLLGYSLTPANRKLTTHYVGVSDTDGWTERIQHADVECSYVQQPAKVSYQRNFQRYTPQAIANTCLSEGLDMQNPRDRASASELLGKRQRKDWTDGTSRKRRMLEAGKSDAAQYVHASVVGGRDQGATGTSPTLGGMPER
jgi:hypothetical protein